MLPSDAARLYFSYCLFKNTQSALIGRLIRAWAGTANKNKINAKSISKCQAGC